MNKVEYIFYKFSQLFGDKYNYNLAKGITVSDNLSQKQKSIAGVSNFDIPNMEMFQSNIYLGQKSKTEQQTDNLIEYAKAMGEKYKPDSWKAEQRRIPSLDKNDPFYQVPPSSWKFIESYRKTPVPLTEVAKEFNRYKEKHPELKNMPIEAIFAIMQIENSGTKSTFNNNFFNVKWVPSMEKAGIKGVWIGRDYFDDSLKKYVSQGQWFAAPQNFDQAFDIFFKYTPVGRNFIKVYKDNPNFQIKTIDDVNTLFGSSNYDVKENEENYRKNYLNAILNPSSTIKKAINEIKKGNINGNTNKPNDKKLSDNLQNIDKVDSNNIAFTNQQEWLHQVVMPKPKGINNIKPNTSGISTLPPDIAQNDLNSKDFKTNSNIDNKLIKTPKVDELSKIDSSIKNNNTRQTDLAINTGITNKPKIPLPDFLSNPKLDKNMGTQNWSHGNMFATNTGFKMNTGIKNNVGDKIDKNMGTQNWSPGNMFAMDTNFKIDTGFKSNTLGKMDKNLGTHSWAQGAMFEMNKNFHIGNNIGTLEWAQNTMPSFSKVPKFDSNLKINGSNQMQVKFDTINNVS